MQTFDVTAVFSACISALTDFILWAKTTYIFLGGYSFSVYSVAVGSLVVSSIIASFLPWDDDDETEESVF